jgi:hypothetical protein
MRARQVDRLAVIRPIAGGQPLSAKPAAKHARGVAALSSATLLSSTGNGSSARPCVGRTSSLTPIVASRTFEDQHARKELGHRLRRNAVQDQLVGVLLGRHLPMEHASPA